MRAAVVEYALRYVGVREEPAGSNLGPQSGRYAHVIEKWQRWANGLTGYAWCAAFVCGMWREKWGLIVPEPRRASVGFLEQWAAENGEIVKRPLRGDLVCYRFDADNWPDHIGFVVKVIGLRWFGGRFVGTLKTLEGNTSAGNDANGGQVQIRWRTGLRWRFIRLDPAKLQRVSSGV
jgi:hypothetical protein